MSAPMDDRLHWQIESPISTHFRPATCAEIACPAYQHGWRIRVDALSREERRAMSVSGRRYQVVEVAAGETYWVFEAGQPCFRASTHRVPVGRPELYVVRERDQVRRYDRGDQWANDCAEHTTKIVDKIKEG